MQKGRKRKIKQTDEIEKIGGSVKKEKELAERDTFVFETCIQLRHHNE